MYYNMIHLTEEPNFPWAGKVFEEDIWWPDTEAGILGLIETYEVFLKFETTYLESIDGTKLFVLFSDVRGWRVIQTR